MNPAERAAAMKVTLEEVLAWLDEEAAKAEAKIPLPGMGGYWEELLGTEAYQAPARRIVALYRTAAEHIRACRCTPPERIGEPLIRGVPGEIVAEPEPISQETLDQIAEIERHIRRF